MFSLRRARSSSTAPPNRRPHSPSLSKAEVQDPARGFSSSIVVAFPLKKMKRPSSSSSRPSSPPPVRPLRPRRASLFSRPSLPQLPPPPPEVLPPPRPARNPARPRPGARPSTSGGVPALRSSSPDEYARSLKDIPSSSIFSAASSKPSPALIRKASYRQNLKKSISASLSTSTSASASSPPSRSTSATSRTTSISTSAKASARLKFSTADRAILEELRQNLSARDSQFVRRRGKKHHPFSEDDVPYPRNYERDVVDNDIWDVDFFQRALGSPTAHVFDSPPAKILELGCGAGSWIITCARQWKHSQFVGVDVVPLQPDLFRVGSSDLASRITWVQANFLEVLPFPSEEFDFVHIGRIALGVPEDRWDGLFEELLRVMKPGAAIEIFEEDLYFPGSASAPPVHTSPATSFPPTPPLTNPPTPEMEHDTLKATRLSTPLQLSQPSETTPKATMNNANGLYHPGKKQCVNPRDHTILEMIWTEMHAARFINLAPLALLGNLFPLFFKDVRTHAPISLTFPPTPTQWQNRTSANADWGDEPTSPVRSNVKAEQSSDGETNDSHSDLRRSRTQISHISTRYARDPMQEYVVPDYDRSPALPLPSQQSPLASKQQTPFRTHLPSPDLGPTSDTDISYTSRPFPPVTRPSTNGLPNSTLIFDVNTLNPHLLTRLTEVLACAEAMWDWVLDYQKQLKVLDRTNPNAPSREPEIRTQLRQMTRADFDHILSWFEMDMRDCIALGDALETRLGWKVKASAPTPERRAFDRACERWDRRHVGIGSDKCLICGTQTPLQQQETANPARRLSRTMRVFAAWKAS